MNWVAKAKVDYCRMAGLPEPKLLEPYKLIVNVRTAWNIAEQYEVMKHEPHESRVATSYRRLITQLGDQLELLVDRGLVFERWLLDGEPYCDSKHMRLDVLERKHLYYLPTEGNFGIETQPEGNPLVERTSFSDQYDYLILANDAFRIVHDVFGHSVCDNGFGANGEEVAWRSHREMFTYGAIGALTSETRGQNSWVNFGAHVTPDMSPAQRPFAQQKTGLMPEWTWNHE